MTSEGTAAPNRPSPGPLILVILLAAVMLAGLGLWIHTARNEVAGDRRAVEQSYRSRLALSDLLATLNRAETAQRGYVITGNGAFLAPYAPARHKTDMLLARLRTAYADDPSQQARIGELGAVVAAKFAEMDEVLARRRTGGVRAATARVADGEGRRLMERAGGIVADAIVAEDRILLAQLRHAREEALWISRAVWALLILSTAGIAASLFTAGWARMGGYRLELRSHAAHARLEAVFAGTLDALLIFGPTGELERMNEAAVRLLGYEADELAALDAAALIGIVERPGPFPERIGAVGGRLPHPMRVDRVARHRDGHDVPIDIALGLMPLPDGLHIIASLRDISERKTAERLKDEFISTVSHELRTPLTSVVGSLGLLAGSVAGELPEPARRLVTIAESNSRRLIRLINDILDIDRIGSGRNTLETAELDLRDLLRDSAQAAQGLAATRAVTLTVDLPAEPVRVIGDAERLMQVAGNLLSNAIRFSPEGGVVALSLSGEGEAAKFSVEDRGPGIAPDFRERIFGRFAQSGAGAAIPGGTGLGLAISREIVRAHGGSIWFEDRDGGGARFCVSLSLVPAPAADEVRSGRILVVEDDAEAASVLCSMIEARGYAVESCGSAREAQLMARKGRYDGVVLDLRLPDASGLTAVRGLRAFGETRALPIIVVSAFARDGESDPSAHALDVIDWIEKPVDPARLINGLKLAMCRSSRQRPVILHIDDDPDMLEVTAMALAGQGQMMSATTLAAARELLARRTPDVVILDLTLPDGSGLELLPEMFSLDGAAVPTIIYSATDPAPDAGQQFDAVLIKSRRSLHTLSEAIGGILERRLDGRPGGA